MDELRTADEEEEEEDEEPVQPVPKVQTGFDDEVVQLLRQMELNDVFGGPGFKIAGESFGAVGGINDTLLLFDCSVNRGKRNTSSRVKSKINELRGKAPIVTREALKQEAFSKYKTVAMVMAANATVRKEDKDYGTAAAPHISVLDRQLLDYFETISNDIGRYAAYRLANLLGLHLKRGSRTIPALKVVDRGKSYYMFCAAAQEVAEISLVPQTEAGFTYFYQRMIKPPKIRAIRNYVADMPRPFPNSVVLAMMKDPHFDAAPKTANVTLEPGVEVISGHMKLPEEYGSCWVIDGQHRIYGSALSQVNVALPVTLIPATDKEKAKLFLDINSKQSRIDANLMWDLRGMLMSDDPMGRISLAVQQLDKLENPIKECIKIPHQGVGKSRKIRLSGLCDTVKRQALHSTDPYQATSKDFVSSLSGDLARWFTCVDKALASTYARENWVFDNGGLAVLIELFKRLTLVEQARPSDEALKTYADAFSKWITQLNEQDIRGFSRRSSSSARSQIADEAASFMNSQMDKDHQLNLSGRAEELIKDIQAFELDAREYLDTVFTEKIGPSWIKRVLAGEGKRPPSKLDEFTLGQMMKLLEIDEFWICIKGPFEGARVSKALALSMFGYVVDYRNAHVHNRPEDLRKTNPTILKAALQTLRLGLAPRK